MLETVGSDEPLAGAISEESKQSLENVDKKISEAIEGSDLDDLLKDSAGSKDFTKNLTTLVKSKEHTDWEVLGIMQDLRKKVRFASEQDEPSESGKPEGKGDG